MKKIIMDIDSVGDDILAVIYMTLKSNADIVGITTVNGASGDICQATWVAQNLVSFLKKDIPVYAGANQPLVKDEREKKGDPVNFHEIYKKKFGERLKKLNEKAVKPKKEIEKKNAVDFLIETINKYPEEITLVTTGPLTNIALALEKDWEICNKVKEAYVLGGAFKIHGNISPVTEYNICADPEAAKKVLESDMKITLVPLDVCENNTFSESMLTYEHLSQLEGGKANGIVEYICDKFPIYIDVWKDYFQLEGFPMDDVITAALALDESFCEYTDPLHVTVELAGEFSRGQSIAFTGKQINFYPEREKKNVRIAKFIYGEKFMNDFIQTINS